jgi:DNA-binding CsgD family transcriptional regulator
VGRRDLLAILDAAYAVDRSDDEWLAGIAESVRVNLPFTTIGVVVNSYDISDPERAQLDWAGVRAAGDVDRLAACWRELQSLYEGDPERLRATYGTLDEGFGLEAPVGQEYLARVLRSLKMGDVYGINGRNPSGHGLLVGLYLPAGFVPISQGTRRMFARIARHLAAAHRLRQKLVPERTRRGLPEADAILTSDGAVEHATGAARAKSAREELRRSALAMTRARRGGREGDPDRALARWKALVDARWSLVDHFERDGSYYLVAHRNDCQPAPVALLTERERQVVALATMGFANKEIAYELGLATSTVGVLVGRAMRRLGVRSRRELVRDPTNPTK